MKKIYICSQPNYLIPFRDIFEQVSDIKRADVVMFTGGSDVSPHLYGENTGRHTYCDPVRDKIESVAFDYALHTGKPMLGICRGAQFLNVLSGGKLIQDVSDHTNNHMIYTNDGRQIYMSSTHHQMMYPDPLASSSWKLLAYAEHRSRHYTNGDNREIIPHFGNREPEILWYPRTKALCIQGHPEYLPIDSAGVAYCRELVNQYLIKE